MNNSNCEFCSKRMAGENTYAVTNMLKFNMPNFRSSISRGFVIIGLILIYISSVYSFNLDIIQRFVFTNGHPGSYFGYSVALLDYTANTKWVLVGAPRDNNTNLPGVVSPGALYQCDRSACTQLTVDDDTGQETLQYLGKFYIVTHGKDNQGLGASIDVNDQDKSTVVCAPRWFNKYYEFSDSYFMNGMCYKISGGLSSLNVQKIPALVDHRRQLVAVSGGTGYFFYGMAGLGMSAHFTQDGSDLLIGAPGLQSWTGGFVDLRDGRQQFVLQSPVQSTETSELVGYAVTSGKYFTDRKTYFVMGSPRSKLNGLVLLYYGDEGESYYTIENAVIALYGGENDPEESKIGSYFGAALCTVDVNNDGLDDLLVGAPLYTDELDEGRVFVYLSKSTGQRGFQLSSDLLSGSNKINARFGTAITSLGDMNFDGYNDVAIGAPYEDYNMGAVYIYNGYKDGIWRQYSQRILGGIMHSFMRGFGISFSKPVDMNGDAVNDVAIGAYLSDHAVLLFGRKVVNLAVELKTSADVINYFDCIETISQPCFDISFCATHQNTSVERIILSLNVSLENDDRLSFERGGIQKSFSLEPNFIITSTSQQCSRTFPVYVQTTTNLVSPIKIKVEYDEIDITTKDQSALRPTLNRFNGDLPKDLQLKEEKQITFTNNCPNNICVTDLQLSSTLSYVNVSTKNYFIIGIPLLSIDVNITRTGDPSFGSQFTLSFPGSLEYRRIDSYPNDTVKCDLNSNQPDLFEGAPSKFRVIKDSVLLCSLGRYLEDNPNVSFTLHINVPDRVTEDEFMFTMNVTTLSQEISPFDNVKTFTLPVKNEVSTNVSGASRPEFFTIRENGKSYETNHVYEIRNYGPSLLPLSTVQIQFPQVQIAGKDKLYLNSSQASCPEPCMLRCGVVGALIRQYVQAVGIANKTDFAGDIYTTADIRHVDCRKSSCVVYECDVSNIPPKQSAVISLNFIIDQTLLESVSGGQGVFMTSVANVKLDDDRLISDTLEYNTNIITQILPKTPPPRAFQWWIIAVSALGGLVFIFVISLIFWKCGFFERKTKQKLVRRRSQWMEHERRKSQWEENEKRRNSEMGSEPDENGLNNPGFSDSNDISLEKSGDKDDVDIENHHEKNWT